MGWGEMDESSTPRGSPYLDRTPMPSIDRPRPVVTISAEPKHASGGGGSVHLQVAEGGTVSLTPDEARTLADHLHTGASEAEAEQPRRRINLTE